LFVGCSEAIRLINEVIKPGYAHLRAVQAQAELSLP